MKIWVGAAVQQKIQHAEGYSTVGVQQEFRAMNSKIGFDSVILPHFINSYYCVLALIFFTLTVQYL